MAQKSKRAMTTNTVPTGADATVDPSSLNFVPSLACTCLARAVEMIGKRRKPWSYIHVIGNFWLEPASEQYKQECFARKVGIKALKRRGSV
jgi:hypothetical protein